LVTGVDISEDQLRLARERVGDAVELVQADASELPFPDQRFDAILSAFTHSDVDDFEGLVREARHAFSVTPDDSCTSASIRAS
jgi:ubiquinone/menaquinone biosynthesis C-methylase UbiE